MMDHMWSRRSSKNTETQRFNRDKLKLIKEGH